MSLNRREMIIASTTLFMLASCRQKHLIRTGFSTQLNWLHDPTFAAQYRLLETVPGSNAREGGAAISPISMAETRAADFSICGIDIFFDYVVSAREAGRDSKLRAIFCDFVKNPVGWVLAPGQARQLGLDVGRLNAGDREERRKIVSALRSGRIKIGDKTGTETTAVLRSWLRRIGMADIRPISVGFDASVVANNPPLLFPVYLNEEPFKLSNVIGQQVAVVDPSLDGVRLYGNIIVTSLDTPRGKVADYRDALRASWNWTRANLDEAVTLIGKYYKDVPRDVMRGQVTKTIDLAFDTETEKTGHFDLAAGGMLEKSLETLAKGGATSTLSLANVSQLFSND